MRHQTPLRGERHVARGDTLKRRHRADRRRIATRLEHDPAERDTLPKPIVAPATDACVNPAPKKHRSPFPGRNRPIAWCAAQATRQTRRPLRIRQPDRSETSKTAIIGHRQTRTRRYSRHSRAGRGDSRSVNRYRFAGFAHRFTGSSRHRSTVITGKTPSRRFFCND